MSWMYPNKQTSLFEKTFPLQFVINMDHREDRLAQVREQFSWLGLEPMRLPGKTYEDKKLPPQVRGAIGCYLSHMTILQFALDMKQNVFIFEDDFLMVRDDTKQILNEACEDLWDINPLNWAMLYGGANILSPCTQVSERLAKLTHAQSTVCYGVNWIYIPRILELLHVFDAPIDMMYASKIVKELNCYITIPMVAIQRDSYSDIEGQEVQYSSYLEKRYWANLVKKLDN